MVLYFLSFVLLLSAEAGIDPLSWGLFGYALIIFLFSFIFLVAQSLCEFPCGWASSKRFCSLKALKSIQELTNCTVKGWLMVLVMWIQEKKWVHCTTEFKWIRIACSKRILFEAFCCFEKKNKKEKKNQTLPSDWFLGPMLSYLIVFKPWLVLCNALLFMYFLFWNVNHWHISDFPFFCSFLWDLSSTVCYLMQLQLLKVVDSETFLYSSQVGLLMWGGNSALNPAWSLWQYYLWTVVGHTLFWGCQMLFKANTLPESVLPQAHSDTNKDVVIHHLHFHWLQGPKCKQTQLTEQFASIKHPMRAFKVFTFSHR